MDNTSLSPPLAVFQEELREELAEFLWMLDNIFGEEAIARLLNRPQINTFKLEGADVDLEQFAMQAHATVLYYYAIEATLLRGWAVPNLEDSLGALDVICRLNTELQGTVRDSVQAVWRKAMARTGVDTYRAQEGLADDLITTRFGEQPSTIEDVAWLCGMSPASVRNSTTVNARDRLLTRRQDGRVVVDDASLLDWLSRRRGYRETVVEEVQAPENERFRSAEELAEFISVRGRNLKLGHEQWAQALGTDDVNGMRHAFGKPPDVAALDLDTLIRLAGVLKLTETDFISRATRIVLEEKLKAADLWPKGEVVPLPRR